MIVLQTQPLSSKREMEGGFTPGMKTMGRQTERQAEPCRIVVDKLTGFLTISFMDLRFIQINAEQLTM